MCDEYIPRNHALVQDVPSVGKEAETWDQVKIVSDSSAL